MAGLPWFELDVDFHESPKVRALASRLREPLADAYVARVYAYCYRHARDRFDPEVACETLEEAARWRGRRGTLFDALFAIGVLEREAGRVVVHGVADRLAPHIAQRTAAAKRQRKRRENAALSIDRHAPVTRDVPRDVPRDVERDVTRESRRDTDTDTDKDKKLASAEQIRPLAVHLEGQCPALADALRRTPLVVDPGKRAVLWGEADAIVRAVGVEAVLACWLDAADRRGQGDRVPLSYLVHPMRDLSKRPAKRATLPAPDPLWLESLGSRQPEALAEWNRMVDSITGPQSPLYPERQPGALQSALTDLVEQFSEAHT